MSTAVAAIQHSLRQIRATDGQVNAFTAVLAERALRRAEQVDAGAVGGPLAGVPFAVKNLFDLQGLPTLAGSAIEREAAPAARDAVLVRRLEAAGAVCVGALNMDEYAYGFTTENSHVGPTRNPHDLSRLSGGSSGGSAAAVAAGQVPLTLGSDTNGSIRVPASLCGVFGLKPTFGRLPRSGSYPFVASLDHLGPFARSVADLALAYDVMQGPDADDPAQVARPLEPTHGLLAQGADGLRIGVLGGWFRQMAQPAALAAVDRCAAALHAHQTVTWPEVDRARAAAFLITNAEGATLHLPDLKRRAQDFEPLSRDRFLAGALLPAAWVLKAQRLRHWFARQVAQSFQHVDVLLAPATPCTAPPIGTEWLDIRGQRLPARASMGLLTQPVSCIGLPVVSVPLWGMDPEQPHLPIGVQVIAAPWREDLCLRVARALEAAGLAQAPVAPWALAAMATATAAGDATPDAQTHAPRQPGETR
ncbi:MAG: AtzE family amidohydrolase [Rubrivivax sp.]|nr:AtzE family amidohydrolase [Rubrivivax sp.]